MAKKIVLKEEIDRQYKKISRLSLSYRFMSGGISLCLASVSDAFRRSGGQTAIISTCRMQARSLHGVSSTLSEGAELLRIAKETMQNLDAAIRQEVNNADMPTVYGLSYGDATSDAVVFTQEQQEQYLRENEVIEKYNCNEKIEITDYNPITCGQATFIFDYGCTWYAAHRYKEVTGNDLIFTEAWGNNATDWDNNIDKNLFNVNSTSDFNNITSPAIAVQESTGLGHVVFIEAVRDGRVYYSESSYPNTSISGHIGMMSIEDFAQKYSSIITAR